MPLLHGLMVLRTHALLLEKGDGFPAMLRLTLQMELQQPVLLLENGGRSPEGQIREGLARMSVNLPIAWLLIACHRWRPQRKHSFSNVF